MTPKERLSGLRGKAYNDTFVAIMVEIGDTVKRYLEAKKMDAGSLVLGDLVIAADIYDLPFKPFVQWLEAEKIVKYGFWDCLQRDGFSLKKMRQQLAERTEAAA